MGRSPMNIHVFYPFVAGLLSAVFWGSGDFFAKVSMGKWGGGVAWVLWGQAMGTGMYLAFFLLHYLSSGELPPLPDLKMTLAIVALGAVGLLAYLAFFTALERTDLAVAAPLSAAWVGVAFLLSAIFLPHRLSPLVWALLLAIAIGVVLLSTGEREKRDWARAKAGFLLALLSAAAWGIFNFTIQWTSEAAGPLLPIFSVKAWGALLWIAALCRKCLPKPELKHRGHALALPAAALFDILAYTSYALGSQHGPLPFVAVSASLFSLIAAVLGIIFLRERLTRLQSFGLLLVILSGALLLWRASA